MPSRSLIALGLAAAVVIATAAAIIYAMQPDPIDVIRPIRGPAVEAAYATGTVEASVMFPVAARISARLMEIDADEGTQVTKGQILGRLEDEDLRNALLQLKVQEGLARQDYRRYAGMVNQGAIAKQTFEHAKADWQAAQAATARAEAELGFMTLVAPAGGRVIRRDGEIGQLIPANQTVFWITGPAPLRISADVDEEDVSRVVPGQDVLIRADAFPGRIFKGTVTSVTPKGDPVRKLYRVRVGFSEPNPLRIGMTTEVNIVIRQDLRALLVPTSAVRGAALWYVTDGRLVSRQVQLGAQGTDRVEIRSGLAGNEEIVLDPAASIEAGQKVDVRLRQFQ